MKTAILIAAVLILAAGSCFAGTITSVDVQLGTWNGSTFTTDGSVWDSSTAIFWPVGVTNSGYGNSLLVTSVTSNLNLPDGEYWLYMAEVGDSSTAIQITLNYAGGPDVEVFTASGSAEYNDTYTLVSGSGFTANLVSAPQSTYELVGTWGQYAAPGTNGTQSGLQNWILDINSGAGPRLPEPGSWVLLATGLAALIFFNRRRRLA